MDKTLSNNLKSQNHNLTIVISQQKSHNIKDGSKRVKEVRKK